MKAVICFTGLPLITFSGVRAITTNSSARVPFVHRDVGMRDSMAEVGAKVFDRAVAALPRPVDSDLLYRLGAVCRAAQMAGALETALALATQYANDRVQFGRPIGKFQAIQQQMALLAEEAAAALVGVESAAVAVAEARASAEFADQRG